MTAAYLRIGRRRIRVPRRRGVRIALGVGLLVRGLLPPMGYVLLPAALALLSIDMPRLRRWRRRLVVALGRRRRRRAERGRRDRPILVKNSGMPD